MRTFYLTPRAMTEVEDIADELEKTLDVDVAVVPGYGINLHTNDLPILHEAYDILGVRVVEVAPPLRHRRVHRHRVSRRR